MMSKTFLALQLLTILSVSAHGQLQITVDHNTGAAATREFHFKSVPSPSMDDGAANARFELIDGRLDPNGADLNALIDGRLPADEDDPGGNLFFNAGSFGGRIRIDFGRAVEITQINTYSWHGDSRAPQLYKLYGSDARDAKFDASPRRGVDPATCGWTLIATVSTIPDSGEEGGQYAVRVNDARGTLGNYRYLLFDIYPAEITDNWGNTFYSEIDALIKK